MPAPPRFDQLGATQIATQFQFKYVKWLLLCQIIVGLYGGTTVQAQSIIPEAGINGTGTLVTPSGLNPNQIDISGGR
ncbi:MAG: hypothetical protein IGS48_07545, partial [Oscillatoriales cyanobacterium C42_A2020_001]|nr:hypothetical protein [Leptolyngbyaceae cyanobacterium C42_A2020_001]